MTTPAAQTQPDDTQERTGLIRRFGPSRILELAMVAVLVVLVIVATITYPGFLSYGNVSLLIAQDAPLGVVAVGMTLVIIAGGFDLSVGSIFAVSATIYTAFAPKDGSVAGAMALALGAGIVLGLINGIVVTRLRVNPFIATLGTTSLYSGGVLLLSDSKAFSSTNPEFAVLGSGSLFNVVPISVVVLIVAFVLGTILLDRTRFGRSVFAVGGGREAARLSGLNVAAVQGATYVISGALAGLAGVMTASQLSAGQGTMGDTVALDAIAVVVIGGTSLTGGEGRIWKTAVGLLILAVVDNIFFSLAVDSNVQLLVKGAIVIAAVAADQALRRLSR